jgi:DNA-binding LytR/AlgR family response regulator
MRLFIAEDEAPARERLIDTIARVAPHAVVAGSAGSVRAARDWLAAHAAPDVLLLDIQLADGLSLELFRDGDLALPTIFTTAYDQFALAAFKALAIDYLLKPVDDTQLRNAFAKVQALRERFSGARARELGDALAAAPARYRQRWVARKGAGFVAVPVQQVAYFVSLDKLTFMVGSDGARHLLDASLSEVEAELDPQLFFRVNRQTLVAACAVARWSAGGKGRLILELLPKGAGEVQVSQERAAAFREWIGQ